MREAADQLGYRPHPGARSLRGGATGVIALCLTNLTGGALPFAEMEYYRRVVTAATQTDLDSTPNNGSSPTVAEDDEAAASVTPLSSSMAWA